MSLKFFGPKGSYGDRWIAYAMLRDNVQHHLEKGAPGGEFSALHSVTCALGGVPVRLPARKLRNERLAARERLKHLPVEALAISARTKAAVTFTWSPSLGPPTERVHSGFEQVPLLGYTPETLWEVFGRLTDTRIDITEGATASDTVVVCDL